MSQWTRAFTGGSMPGQWQVTLDYIITEQDIANNRTYIELRNYVHSVNGVYTQNGGWDGRLYVNGGEVNRNTPSANVGSNWYLLNAWGGWIGHEGNGTKYITVGNYVNAPINDAGRADIGWTLPTIPRKANITAHVANINDEDNPWVEFSNPGGFAINVWFTLPGLTGSTRYAQRNSVGSRHTWTLTTTERDQLRTAMVNINSTPIEYVVETYLGGSYDYSYSGWYTLTIINATPTFPDFTYSDTNAVVTAITGNNQILVSNKSTLSAVVSVANKMGVLKQATAVNYVATFDGIVNTQPYSATLPVTLPIGAITSNGLKTLTVRANDSRLNSLTVSKDITVVPYDIPDLTILATRLNNFDNATTIKTTGVFSRLIIATVDKNSITAGSLKYRTRQDGGTWGALVPITFTTGVGTLTASDVVISLLNSSTWDIEVSVTDKFGTISETATVGRGVPILMVSDNLEAVGIGKMPDVGGRKGLYVLPTDNIWLQLYAVGDIFYTTNPANPTARFGGTWVAFGTGRTPVGVDVSQTEFNTVEKTGGHKLLQSHNHTPYGTSSTSNGDYIGLVGGGQGGWGLAGGTNNNIYRLQLANTGGGDGQNMPPYITCYMWKRTA